MILKYTPEALADFRAILKYGHETFGYTTAEAYGAGLIDKIDILGDHPKAGRPLQSHPAQFRSLRYRAHLVFYQIGNEHITIIRILDARQNWRALRLD